jgi:hypothetical protein
MTLAALNELPPTQPPRPRLTLTPHEGPGELTVRVRGDVDAANAKDFADAVLALVDGDRRVTLDLVELGFLAIDGVAALHAVNARLAHADVPWTVLPGEAALRVLRLCDPESVIPVTTRVPVRRGRGGLRLVES